MLEAFNFYALMHITYTSPTLNVLQGNNSVCLLNYSTMKVKISCNSQSSVAAKTITPLPFHCKIITLLIEYFKYHLLYLKEKIFSAFNNLVH